MTNRYPTLEKRPNKHFIQYTEKLTIIHSPHHHCRQMGGVKVTCQSINTDHWHPSQSKENHSPLYRASANLYLNNPTNTIRLSALNDCHHVLYLQALLYGAAFLWKMGIQSLKKTISIHHAKHRKIIIHTHSPLASYTNGMGGGSRSHVKA